MRVRWGRILVVFLIIWLGALLYFFGPLWKNGDKEAALAHELLEAQKELVRLHTENSELRSLLREVQTKMNSAATSKDRSPQPDSLSDVVSKFTSGPSKEYEVTRRKIRRNLNEFWWFARDQMGGFQKRFEDNAAFGKDVDNILIDMRHRYQVIQANLDELAAADGYETWRQQESRDLSALVQKRLHHLQNPEDCEKAKKLTCNLNKGCGYGCQIHHAMYCFITAYGTGRTLILKSRGWRYDKQGFEHVFEPLSDTCSKDQISESRKPWPGDADTPVVELPIVDSVNPRPKYLPPSIPRDLADRIITLHGDPVVWWVSQFLKYMLRPQPEVRDMLQENVDKQGWQHPIVGIHIRRTDKVGTEAAFHGVEEYMKYVEEYYVKLEIQDKLPDGKRRVFVASDDPKVLAECRKKFPDYVFLGDQSIAKSAAVSSRYTSNSLRGVIIDIHLLSLTDYLVCTFSSQVCRIAYELQQLNFVDAADRFKSLDDIWYYGGQDEHQQEAVMNHTPRNRHEVDLKVGDVLGVAGNHWNGYNKGRNHRSNRIGLYPEYKTKEKLRIVDFPTYPQVKL